MPVLQNQIISIQSISISAIELVDTTTINIILIKNHEGKAKPITIAFGTGTKVPGGSDLSDITYRNIKLNQKIKPISFSYDDTQKVFKVTIKILSSFLPESGHQYTRNELKELRTIPLGIPPVEISFLDAVSVLSSPEEKTSNTILEISFRIRG